MHPTMTPTPADDVSQAPRQHALLPNEQNGQFETLPLTAATSDDGEMSSATNTCVGTQPMHEAAVATAAAADVNDGDDAAHNATASSTASKFSGPKSFQKLSKSVAALMLASASPKPPKSTSRKTTQSKSKHRISRHHAINATGSVQSIRNLSLSPNMTTKSSVTIAARDDETASPSHQSHPSHPPTQQRPIPFALSSEPLTTSSSFDALSPDEVVLPLASPLVSLGPVTRQPLHHSSFANASINSSGYFSIASSEGTNNSNSNGSENHKHNTNQGVNANTNADAKVDAKKVHSTSHAMKALPTSLSCRATTPSDVETISSVDDDDDDDAEYAASKFQSQSMRSCTTFTPKTTASVMARIRRLSVDSHSTHSRGSSHTPRSSSGALTSKATALAIPLPISTPRPVSTRSILISPPGTTMIGDRKKSPLDPLHHSHHPTANHSTSINGAVGAAISRLKPLPKSRGIRRSTSTPSSVGHGATRTPLHSRPSHARQNRLSQYSQQRLNFNKVRRTIGRDEQYQLVQAAWDQCVETLQQRQAFMDVKLHDNLNSSSDEYDGANFDLPFTPAETALERSNTTPFSTHVKQQPAAKASNASNNDENDAAAVVAPQSKSWDASILRLDSPPPTYRRSVLQPTSSPMAARAKPPRQRHSANSTNPWRPMSPIPLATMRKSSIKASKSSRHLVMLSGASGTGKSTLVARLEGPCYAKYGCYVRVKFDLKQRQKEDEPMYGIKTAMSQLCHQLSQLPAMPRANGQPGMKRNDNSALSLPTTIANVQSNIMNQSIVAAAAATTASEEATVPAPPPQSPNLQHEAKRSPAATPGLSKHRQNDPRSLHEIRLQLLDGLSNQEWEVLAKIIPNLTDVIGGDAMLKIHQAAAASASAARNSLHERTSSVKMNDGAEGGLPTEAATTTPSLIHETSTGLRRVSFHLDDAISYQAMSDQLRFACTRFLQIVNQTIPIVMVFDDTQWADPASLDMMSAWISDSDIASLLLVMSYRSEWVDPPQESLPAEPDVASEQSFSATPSHMTSSAAASKAYSAPLVQTLQTLENNQHDRSIKLTRIELGNLTVDQFNDFLVDLLDPEKPEDTLSLAKIAHRKTGGNIFFLQEFIRSLTRDNLLQYNIGLTKWRWDDEEIQKRSTATTNMLELMQAKLNHLTTAQYVLPLAACIGSSFSWYLLRLILQGFLKTEEHTQFYRDVFQVDPPTVDTTQQEIMPTCCIEGLIEHSHDPSLLEDCGDCHGEANGDGDDDIRVDASGGRCINDNTQYRFFHDKVQEVSLSVVPHDRLWELQFRMGSILLNSLQNDELEQYLFVIINLLNTRLDMVPPYSGDPSDTTRLTIASLNHMAGVTAIAYSAFRAATSYFQNSLSLLPNNHWETHYELSLDLFSSLAECAFVNSNMTDMERFSSIVINRKCPMIDKMRVYHVLMNAASGRSISAGRSGVMELGLTILSKLGYPLPKSKFSQRVMKFQGLTEARSSATKWIKAARSSLTISKSPVDLAILKTLDSMTICAYTTKPEWLPLIVFKSIKYTLEHGITLYSPPAFAMLGVLLGPVMGDFAAARMSAEAALDMLSKVENRAAECRTVSLCYGLVKHWTQPFNSCKEPMLTAYRIGMAVGDVDSSMWCMIHYLDFAWHTGVNLFILDQDFFTYARLMQDFKREKQHALMVMNWQLILNLRGLSNHKTQLIGDAFDENEALARYRRTKDRLLEVATMKFQLQACVLFGQMEEAASIGAKIYNAFRKITPGVQACAVVLFHTGLACYALMNDQRGSASHINMQRKRYAKIGKRCRKKLTQWIKQGNPNCVHFVRLIDAERESWKGSRTASTRFFEASIRVSGRSGLIHDQALATERFGECLLRQGDKISAKYKFEDAISLYSEWGARHKVELLEARLQTIWPPPDDPITQKIKRRQQRRRKNSKKA